MFDWLPLAYTLIVLIVAAALLWIVSIIKRDVGIVDSFWSLFILLSAFCFYTLSDYDVNQRASLVLILVVIWAVRLAAHISWRNWGQEEDLRYQVIRENNQSNFKYKSFYIVFLLQAILALIIALPLLSVFNSAEPLNKLDYFAVALWLFGMFFEVVGDVQLAIFKSNKSNQGKVLNTGLWRYTRHPNYFGEFCIWWAFFIFAVASGFWWSVISPLLLTLLLLKVSGVSLLESTIQERRPAYADYIKSTNAFFPWRPRKFLSHKDLQN